MREELNREGRGIEKGEGNHMGFCYLFLFVYVSYKLQVIFFFFLFISFSSPYLSHVFKHSTFSTFVKSHEIIPEPIDSVFKNIIYLFCSNCRTSLELNQSQNYELIKKTKKLIKINKDL